MLDYIVARKRRAPKRSIDVAPDSVVALAHSGVLLGGVEDSEVSEEQQAELIVSVALWSLRESHALDFTFYERWLGSRVLAVELVTDDVVGPSLEEELLAETRWIATWPHREKIRVRTVVDQWLLVTCRGAVSEVLGITYNPHGKVIEIVSELAEKAGWHPVTRIYSRGGVTIHPARAARLQAAAQDLAADWQRFQRDESDIAGSLMATVHEAFYRRTYAGPDP